MFTIPMPSCIRVVQDNLSTHSAGALYQAFPPAEARRILRRLEFHYTPKHASWLNMVEIEIGVLRGQCLDRRIDDPKRLFAKSPPGNDSATTPAPTSNGCSSPTTPAPKCAAPIQTRREACSLGPPRRDCTRWGGLPKRPSRHTFAPPEPRPSVRVSVFSRRGCPNSDSTDGFV